MTEHEGWMEYALSEAWEALERGDTPVGAVVVAEGNVVGRGQHRDQSSLDLTAVAELEALRAAAAAIHSRRLRCRLYTTVEPSLLGAGAVLAARLGTLVFGLTNAADGAVVRLQAAHHWPLDRPAVISGVAAPACAALLQESLRRSPNGFVADWCRTILERQ
jgi:tRNA(adenine34) deaminase